MKKARYWFIGLVVFILATTTLISVIGKNTVQRKNLKTMANDAEKLIGLTVVKYQKGNPVEKNMAYMQVENLYKMQQDLKKMFTTEGRIALLKSYNVISNNVAMNEFREDSMNPKIRVEDTEKVRNILQKIGGRRVFIRFSVDVLSGGKGFYLPRPRPYFVQLQLPRLGLVWTVNEYITGSPSASLHDVKDPIDEEYWTNYYGRFMGTVFGFSGYAVYGYLPFYGGFIQICGTCAFGVFYNSAI